MDSVSQHLFRSLCTHKGVGDRKADWPTLSFGNEHKYSVGKHLTSPHSRIGTYLCHSVLRKRFQGSKTAKYSNWIGCTNVSSGKA